MLSQSQYQPRLNQLKGSILRELQNLTNLILWQNSLSGEIPLEIGRNCLLCI
ncbi:hypothetical protein AHAS_Ahas15G0283100 [Arachis hypogaea]